MPFDPKYNSKNLPDASYVNNWFKGHIGPFMKDFRFNPDSRVQIDSTVAQDVVRCFFDDMDRYDTYSGITNPSIFKKMGHLAFWIRKLKPISTVEPTDPQFGHQINETFALTLAMFYCNLATENPQLGNTPEISPHLWHDLLFFFRYKSVSPHSLTMLLNAMYSVKFRPS